MRTALQLMVAAGVALTQCFAACAAVEPAIESAIRKHAATFEELVNKKDAPGIAALWTPDATLIDASGKVTVGRSEIEKLYGQVLKQYPNAKIQIAVKQIESPSAETVVERGVTTFINGSEPLSQSTYVAVNKFIDGNWFTSHVSESKATLVSPKLNQLAWLQGKWKVSGEPGSSMTNSYLGDGQFFLSVFEHLIGGKKQADLIVTFEEPGGGPLIGALFSANGAHGTGLWERLPNGDWSLHAERTGVDGTVVGGTHIFAPLNAESFKWQTVARSLDGKKLEDTAPQVVLREK